MEEQEISKETVVHNAGSSKPQVFMKSNIKLVVWTNTNSDNTKTFENYNIRRVYKNKDDDWRETDGYTLRDLRLIHELIGEFLAFKTPMKAL